MSNLQKNALRVVVNVFQIATDWQLFCFDLARSCMKSSAIEILSRRCADQRMYFLKSADPLVILWLFYGMANSLADEITTPDQGGFWGGYCDEFDNNCKRD